MSVAARVSTSATPSTTMPVGDGPVSANHLDHDDTGALGILPLRQAELEAQVHYRDDLATQVDHAFHMGGGLRQGGDVAHSHDFADLQNPNAELFGTQFEDEVLSGAVVAVELRRRIFL